MVRAIVLSLFFVIGVGAFVPLISNSAEASAEMSSSPRKNRKKYKKFSKAWWRAYNKRSKRNRAAATRRRALRLRQIRFANALKNSENGIEYQNKAGSNFVPAIVPPGEDAPKSRKRSAKSPIAQQPSMVAASGAASVTIVSPAVAADDDARSKTVGGVPVANLRRMVIDQMLREEGWVVNDYQKQVGGKKVFVVVAYSAGAGGATLSRLFYFTEADGQIYRVATSAPGEKNFARLEQESERAVASLGRNSNGVQQAELKP